MLTDYENFTTNHTLLQTTTDPVVISTLSKSIVEDYLNNRLIWDELNYFKKHNTLLGKHKIHDWLDRQAEIRKMNVPELVRLKTQLENNIPRTRRNITLFPEHKETPNRQLRLSQFEHEFFEVKSLLGLHE